MIFSRVKKNIDEFIKTVRIFLEEIKKNSAKVGKLKRLWTDERFSDAKKVLFKNILKVLGEIRPKKGKADLRYGADDPYKTGQAAFMYVLFSPLVADWMDFEPVFEDEILETRVDIKGRVRLFFLLKAALIVFFNKKLRLLYRKTTQILRA